LEAMLLMTLHLFAGHNSLRAKYTKEKEN